MGSAALNAAVRSFRPRGCCIVRPLRHAGTTASTRTTPAIAAGFMSDLAAPELRQRLYCGAANAHVGVLERRCDCRNRAGVADLGKRGDCAALDLSVAVLEKRDERIDGGLVAHLSECQRGPGANPGVLVLERGGECRDG